MKPALIVATRGWNPHDWIERIRPLLPERSLLATDPDGRFSGPPQALDEVHYALAWRPLPETLDRLKNLGAIFSLGAGVDHILSLPHLPQVPIVRVVDPDLTMRMREYVVWQVLDHLRYGAIYRRQQREHVWQEPDHHATAHDLTVGIMGLGVMGAHAAEALLALGFVVRGWSRTRKALAGVETFAGADGLAPFLSGTDILVVLLPLTPETQGIIDLKLLRGLSRTGPLGGPILINAGRGGLQVEADIVAALRDGMVAGASLDVFGEEPLPAESPLWDLDTVTITPHVAAVSDPQAIGVQIVRQIEAFERGEPLRNCVDPERGY